LYVPLGALGERYVVRLVRLRQERSRQIVDGVLMPALSAAAPPAGIESDQNVMLWGRLPHS